MKPTLLTWSNLLRKAFACAIALGFLAALPAANAADGTWTGGTSTNWTTTANWSGGTVAGSTNANSDTATFNSSSYLNQPTIANGWILGTLLFGSGNTGALTVNTGNNADRLNLSGGIQMNAGSGAVIIGAANNRGIALLNNVSFANNSSSQLTVRVLTVDESVLSGTNTVTINGSGSGGFTLSAPAVDGTGGGKLALNINTSGGATLLGQSSTYSGGTTLSAGTLQVGVSSVGSLGTITSGAIGTGSLALNGGTLSSGSGAARTILNAVTIGGNVTLGDATNNGTITMSNSVDLGGSVRTLTTASAVNIDGIVSNGGITKLGTGVLTLRGASANTYSGLTTVSAGGLTLTKTGVNAIAGDVKIDTTGTLTLGAADQIINTANVEIATGGTFALAGFTETVNGVQLTGGAITGTAGNTLTSTTAYDFQSGSATAILAGTAGATKSGSGTVTFSGGNANTYTGLTTVSAGNLVLGKTAGVVALAGDALVNGGTLQINNANQIVDTANLEVAAGTFALGGNADTVNGVKLTGGAITGTGTNGILTSITAYDLQSGSSSAVLAGTAGATKTTAGTVALNKASTYSGGTTLSAGTLQLGAASVGSVGAITSSAIGTGSLALNGGQLSSGSGVARTILNAVTVGGNVILGNATNDGKLTFGAGVDLGGATRTLTTDSSVEFSGVVGNGGITKAGNATLTLSGSNSYTGTTTINANGGLLKFTQTTALYGGATGSWDKTNITVNSGGTVGFNVGGIGEFSTADVTTILTGLGGEVNNNGLRGGSAIAFDTANAAGGNFGITDILANSTGTGSGSLGITKLGAGTLTLSGANTFSGALDVRTGTVDLASTVGAAAGSAGSISIASSAVLLLSQNEQLNDGAAVTLSGGTIRTASGINETFGNLSVTGNSFLDFGTTSYANANTIGFGTYTTSALLAIDNFNFGSTMTFKSNLSSADLATFSFTNGGIASSSWDADTSTFTITAIPEPSTYLVAVGLIGLMLWPLRRRAAAVAKRF